MLWKKIYEKPNLESICYHIKQFGLKFAWIYNYCNRPSTIEYSAYLQKNVVICKYIFSHICI